MKNCLSGKMGISVQQWRIKIGCFLPVMKLRTQRSELRLSRGIFSPTLRLLLFMSILLVIGGIEIQPGPPKDLSKRESLHKQSTLTAGASGEVRVTRSASLSDNISADILKNLKDINTELKRLNTNYTELNKKVDQVHSDLTTKYDSIIQ